MSKPRPVFPNRTLLITRRCVGRAFLLSAETEAPQYFKYLLAAAAARFDVKIHAFVLMSNHYHLVLTDRCGQYPAFTGWLNGMVARFVNIAVGRQDSFWDGHQVNVVDLLDADAVARKVAYVLTNPIRAGVAPESILSASFLDLPHAPARLTAIRPPILAARRSSWMELEELEMHAPTEGPLTGLQIDFRALVTHYLQQNAPTVSAPPESALEAGVDPIAGARSRQSDVTKPGVRGGSRSRPKTIPRVASSDPQMVRDYLTMIRRFERLHRDARVAYLEHNENVDFPAWRVWRPPEH